MIPSASPPPQHAYLSQELTAADLPERRLSPQAQTMQRIGLAVSRVFLRRREYFRHRMEQRSVYTGSEDQRPALINHTSMYVQE